MKCVERVYSEYVDGSLDRDESGGLVLEFEDVTKLVPDEKALYTCDCGSTFGEASIVGHLMSRHGEGAPVERLAGMVRPYREARESDVGLSLTIDYDPHPNASVDEPDCECEATNPRDWCHGPDAGSVLWQCSVCYGGGD